MDIDKLPINRSLKRQVDKYLQQKFDEIAQDLHDTLSRYVMAECIGLFLENCVCLRAVLQHRAAWRTDPIIIDPILIVQSHRGDIGKLPQALRVLKLLAGRGEDCCLNGKRRICESLAKCTPTLAKRLDEESKTELARLLCMVSEGDLARKLLPDLTGASWSLKEFSAERDSLTMREKENLTPLSSAPTPVGGAPTVDTIASEMRCAALSDSPAAYGGASRSALAKTGGSIGDCEVGRRGSAGTGCSPAARSPVSLGGAWCAVCGLVVGRSNHVQAGELDP